MSYFRLGVPKGVMDPFCSGEPEAKGYTVMYVWRVGVDPCNRTRYNEEVYKLLHEVRHIIEDEMPYMDVTCRVDIWTDRVVLYTHEEVNR